METPKPKRGAELNPLLKATVPAQSGQEGKRGPGPQPRPLAEAPPPTPGPGSIWNPSLQCTAAPADNLEEWSQPVLQSCPADQAHHGHREILT